MLIDTCVARSGVYAIRNTATGKVYIGSAINIAKRWAQHRVHLSREKHHSRKLQRSWLKHGYSMFKFEALLYCRKQYLLFYEQRAINAYDAFRGGYNTSPTAGSSLGVVASEETKAKQRSAKMGRRLTEEHKAKIGAASRGKTISESHRAILLGNQWARGRKHTPEELAKISESGKGNKYNLGKKFSAEHRSKMSASITAWWATRKNRENIHVD